MNARAQEARTQTTNTTDTSKRLGSLGRRRIVGYLLICVSAVLFCLCATAFVARPNEVHQGTYAWDRVDGTLDKETTTYPALLRYTRARMRGTDEQNAVQIFDIVSRRFGHGDSRESLFSSYPAYFAGFLHPALRFTFSADRIVATGNLGVCSQQSYVLMRLANDVGLRARQVGINGHVVAEIWYHDDWHMFDPDYETFAWDAGHQVASVRELTRDPSLVERAYRDRNPGIWTYYASRQDNTFAPAGAYWMWKANVLLYVTKVIDESKWLFPPILLLIGLLFLRRRS